MERTTFVFLLFVQKACKFIDIRISGFCQLSHALRHCFIAAKSERVESLCQQPHDENRRQRTSRYLFGVTRWQEQPFVTSKSPPAWKRKDGRKATCASKVFGRKKPRVAPAAAGPAAAAGTQEAERLKNLH